MEMPIYYATLELDTESKAKTPRYVLSGSAGKYIPMHDLIGQDGKITMFLRDAERGAKNGTPSKSLQAKGSLNFTGLKCLGNDSQPRYAYGYPPSTMTYSAKRKPNPFYAFRFDCFLFVLHYAEGQTIPETIEMLVIQHGYSIAAQLYKCLCNGELSAVLNKWRAAAQAENPAASREEASAPSQQQ